MESKIKFGSNRIVEYSISSVFILVFLYTGLAKVLDYNIFVGEIQMSPILKGIPRTVYCLIPMLEIITAGLLLVKRGRHIGFIISLILLVGFTFYLLMLLRLDLYLPCSCGGVIEQLSLPNHLGMNVILMVLNVWGIMAERKGQKVNVHKSRQIF